MSIEAMKQAIDALNEAVAFREGGRQKAIDAIAALRTAIQQAEAKTYEPVNLSADVRDYLQEGINNATHCEDADIDYDFANGLSALLGTIYTRPAPGVPDDSKRLDYLQDRGATIDLIQGVADFYPMQFRVGGLHSSANTDVRAAIDAAMLTAAQAQKGGAA